MVASDVPSNVPSVTPAPVLFISSLGYHPSLIDPDSPTPTMDGRVPTLEFEVYLDFVFDNTRNFWALVFEANSMLTARGFGYFAIEDFGCLVRLPLVSTEIDSGAPLAVAIVDSTTQTLYDFRSISGQPFTASGLPDTFAFVNGETALPAAELTDFGVIALSGGPGRVASDFEWGPAPSSPVPNLNVDCML